MENPSFTDHQHFDVQGRLRVYSVIYESVLHHRWFIECWCNKECLGEVDTLTSFVRWCVLDVLKQETYKSRQPFRELKFIDVRAGQVFE
jgi:hypothetical protein